MWKRAFLHPASKKEHFCKLLSGKQKLNFRLWAKLPVIVLLKVEQGSWSRAGSKQQLLNYRSELIQWARALLIVSIF